MVLLATMAAGPRTIEIYFFRCSLDSVSFHSASQPDGGCLRLRSDVMGRHSRNPPIGPCFGMFVLS